VNPLFSQANRTDQVKRPPAYAHASNRREHHLALGFAEFGVVDAGEVNLDVGHRAHQPGEAALEDLEPGA